MGDGAGKIAPSEAGKLIRIALAYHQEHPEISFRRDAWLALIARRLEIIARALAPEVPLADLGDDLVPFGAAYLEELLRYKIQDKADFDELSDAEE